MQDYLNYGLLIVCKLSSMAFEKDRFWLGNRSAIGLLTDVKPSGNAIKLSLRTTKSKKKISIGVSCSLPLLPLPVIFERGRPFCRPSAVLREKFLRFLQKSQFWPSSSNSPSIISASLSSLRLM
jgi:hypothetical protein